MPCHMGSTGLARRETAVRERPGPEPLLGFAQGEGLGVASLKNPGGRWVLKVVSGCLALAQVDSGQGSFASGE